MKFSLEKRIFATLGLFGAAVIAVIGIVIIPMIGKIRTLHTDSEATLEKFNSRGGDIVNVKDLVQKIKTLKSTTEDFPRYLFTAGDELALITALEKNAAVYGVSQKIDNANFDAITNQKARISLTVNGAYSNVMEYLSGVENLPYFLTPEQITLSSGESANPNSPIKNASLHLVLSVYVNP